jgi:hypothetical protein
MIYFIGTILEARTIWEVLRCDDLYLDDGVTFSFPLPFQLEAREAINFLRQHLKTAELEWIYPSTGKWIFDLDKFRLKYESEIEYALNLPNIKKTGTSQAINITPWIDTKIKIELWTGCISVTPQVHHRNHKKATQTTVNFLFTYQDMIEAQSKKIFLSHKGIDKPIVRAYFNVLNTLGFDPWIDEDALVSGTELERGILKGFKDSCAAVFFITCNYIDENFLATEVNYAMAEKRAKKDRFAIIPIVLPEHQDNFRIPALLDQFVWKKPQSHLEVLQEIIKALPIKLGSPIFPT